jgi:Fuc2NAc and GlcNAc transferase
MLSAVALAFGAFLLALALTKALERYALARGIIDVPNARSSHAVPTPRGGGLAIVAVFLTGVVLLSFLQSVPLPLAIALVSAGTVCAVVGFWDDQARLSASTRLAAHFIAAAIALAALGGVPAVQVAGVTVLGGWPAQIVAALAIVWLLNLYNFMDGIDGLAGAEAVTVCIGGAAISHWAGHPAAVIVCLLLAAASAGFLVWNYPPARIFMGDAGSGFLGAVFGVLAVDALHHSTVLFWAWLILLGAFIVDATVTLFRRLARRERVYEAHRSHAYQHAARAFGAHRPVTLGFAAINLVWLLPLALGVAAGYLRGELALVVAWLPLVLAALRLRAGLPDAPLQPSSAIEPSRRGW